jgi:epoxyqueuosine reductase
MVCQDVCPANKDHTAWIIPGGDFSEEETRMILEGVGKEKLPSGIIEKLKKICMFDEYDLLKRNLEVLMNQRKSTKK